MLTWVGLDWLTESHFRLTRLKTDRTKKTEVTQTVLFRRAGSTHRMNCLYEWKSMVTKESGLVCSPDQQGKLEPEDSGGDGGHGVEDDGPGPEAPLDVRY